MEKINFTYHAQFYTATILEWKHLLKDDRYKDIIIDSLAFMVKQGWIIIYAFVIMPNHIHVIWQIQDGYVQEKVQQSFLRFTAQKMKFKLQDTNDEQLKLFKVSAKDREYQFWERNSLGIDLWSEAVFKQKLDYIHNNPVRSHWALAKYLEDYKYSSARFYYTGADDFGFLSHYMG